MVMDFQAILARLADGDPALILPALAAAAVLVAAAGMADLFARDESIEARLATGVSRASGTAPPCRCGATRTPGPGDGSRPRRQAWSGRASR
jgi:hypothetical protein